MATGTNTGTFISQQQYAVAKAITIGGRQYAKGEAIDVSTLPDHKIRQFLNQRLIRPVPPSAAPATPTEPPVDA